jgi:hypothetical protein
LLDLERFGQVIIHAGLQAALSVIHHGVGRQGDDGGMATPFMLAYQAGRCKTIQHRHLAIHQDQVKAAALP